MAALREPEMSDAAWSIVGRRPCPFCGESEYLGSYERSTNVYVVYCYSCGTEGPQAKTHIKAVDAWNVRKEE